MRQFLLTAVAVAVFAALFLVFKDEGPSQSRPLATIRFETLLGAPQIYSERAELPGLPLRLYFNTTGNLVLSRQEDGQIVLWDLDAGSSEKIATTTGAFAYCPTTDHLAYSTENQVGVQALTSREIIHIAADHVEFASWNRDCTRLAFSSANQNSVQLWSVPQMLQVAQLETQMPPRNSLALSSDAQNIVVGAGTYSNSGGHVTQIEVFDLTEGNTAQTILGNDQDDPIAGMWITLFSRDDQSVFVGTQTDGKAGIRRVSMATGKAEWDSSGYASYWVRALALSPDGRLLASGDEFGFLRIRDAQTGELVEEHSTGMVIQSLAFSPDGTRLAVGLKDTSIGILRISQ